MGWAGSKLSHVANIDKRKAKTLSFIRFWGKSRPEDRSYSYSQLQERNLDYQTDDLILLKV